MVDSLDPYRSTADVDRDERRSAPIGEPPAGPDRHDIYPADNAQPGVWQPCADPTCAVRHPITPGRTRCAGAQQRKTS